jgi:excisionase family DNA binding protein
VPRRPAPATVADPLAAQARQATGRLNLPARGPRPTPPRPPASWLTSAEAAARLHVSPKTLARWAADGRLPFQKTLGRHRRYDPAVIDAILQNGTHRATTGPAYRGQGITVRDEDESPL